MPEAASSPSANSAHVTGHINAVIVGNYLTTLGREVDEDLRLLSDLHMPIKKLSKTL